MGDAGSLSIGFLLAGVGLVSSSKATTIAAIAIPVVSLGLPILDTSLAIVRRLLRGEGVHKRDLGHIHHRLQKLGHSPRQVALILFAASGILALASMVFLTPDLRVVGLVLLVIGVITLLAVQRLRIPELMELRRLMDRALRQREVIARSVAIREAAAGIAEARTLDGLGRAVGVAVGRSDCAEAELRLRGDVSEGLPAEGESDGVGIATANECIWSWHFGEAASIPRDNRAAWEVTVPIVDSATDEIIGRLVIKRPFAGLDPDYLSQPDSRIHSPGGSRGRPVD